MKKVALSLIPAASVGTVFSEDARAPSPFSYILFPWLTVPLCAEADPSLLGDGGKRAVEYVPLGLENLSLRQGLLFGFQEL
jgi:hypothetical protein